MTTTTPITARLAHAALAFRGLAPEHSQITIGRITLLPHQVAAVRWLRPRLQRYGGALLADPPGLGKTYVALAIAAQRRETPLIIAPAALRERWQEASRETDVAITFVSTERLSAPAPVTIAQPALVIIDEAHHLRTPSTRRHKRTADLCATATVLLLSATPVQNRGHDLQHIAALFHLPPTRQSAAHLRRRLTLRRSLAQLALAYPDAMARSTVPRVRHATAPALTVRHTELPAALLALPPLPGAGDDGHTLMLLGLLHALRSSDAAARERVRRRIAVTLAIEHTSRAGIHPTRDVIRAWHTTDGDVQLAMPQLFATSTDAPDLQLVDAARAQRLALEAVLRSLTGDGDSQRAIVLRRLGRWCAGPVVAFTQFAATARRLYQLLHRQTGIALLTGSGAQIATGVIDRDEVIARLLHARYRARHDAVRLLITTDVLSEGLSLAGVTTIVHLDLPWTAARLDQRVGRAARIGAPVPAVRVLTLPAPLPDAAQRALRELLARKRQRMTRVLLARDSNLGVLTVLLRIVAGEHDIARAHGWVTMQTTCLRVPLLIAIARVGSDRLLVCLDDHGLRSPSQEDWSALEGAQSAAPQRGSVSRLRRALAAWRAERELSAEVRYAERHRLLARQQADETLVRGERSLRLSLAQQATAQRLTTMSHRREPETNSTVPRRGVQHRRRAVRILCGVSLLPAEQPVFHRP